jgi:hypothetical protein
MALLRLALVKWKPEFNRSQHSAFVVLHENYCTLASNWMSAAWWWCDLVYHWVFEPSDGTKRLALAYRVPECVSTTWEAPGVLWGPAVRIGCTSGQQLDLSHGGVTWVVSALELRWAIA